MYLPWNQKLIYKAVDIRPFLRSVNRIKNKNALLHKERIFKKL